MPVFSDINEFMSGPWPDDLSPTMHRFTGRYEVVDTSNLVTVDVHARRVRVDPVLANALREPADLALWVVAARNLILVRSLVGSLATSPELQWWECAWTLAHAAHSYNLPRESAKAMFGVDTLLGCVLSLSWSSVLALPISDFMRSWARRIPFAVRSYVTWMELGERLLTPTDTVPVCGLPFTADGEDDVEMDDTPGSEGETDETVGMQRMRIPPTDRVETQWALAALTDSEREDVFPQLPTPRALGALHNLVHTLDVFVPVARFMQFRRREIVRAAFGIPVFTGIHDEPQTELQPLAVYVDVSGSMLQWTKAAWTFTRSLPMGTRVYAFSTRIVVADIDSEYVYTDSGTDYNAVAEHILERDVRRVIVVSDDTASMKPKLVKQLREHCDLTYVNVRDGIKPESTLSDAAATTIILDTIT